jgi:putative transposase
VKLDDVSRQAHVEEFHDGRREDAKSHEVGVQVPRGVHSEVSQEGVVRGFEAIFGRSISPIGRAKESRIEEGHVMPDHVHMMIAIPPKYAVSQVVGFIKGKSAIHLARVYGEKKRNFVGQHFWARGYFVSTVGRDEAVIREYIRNQEREDKRLEQMGLWR